MLFLGTESARLEEEETATGVYKSLEYGCLRLPRVLRVQQGVLTTAAAGQSRYAKS
jgi:hypothetical protein